MSRPEIATEEDCARWLNGVWRGIDDWIGEQAAMAELAAKPAAGAILAAKARNASSP